MHYKSIKTIINITSLAEIIIDVIVKHYNFLHSIIPIKAVYLPHTSGFCYVTSMVLNKSSLQHFILKQIVRSRDKTAL